MQVYVAAPYPAREFVEGLFPVLQELGHECTSTWAKGTREIHVGTVGPSLDTSHEDLVKHVEGDLYDIARSSALISLTASFCVKELGLEMDVSNPWLHTGGRHVELGYALALGIRKIVVGEPENVFMRGFCRIVDDIPSAIVALGS